MTVCNMSIEAGARAGMIAPDETTFAYLQGRPHAPQGADWDAAVAYWRTLRTDDDATFDDEVVIDARRADAVRHLGHQPGPGRRRCAARSRPRPTSGRRRARRRRAGAGVHGPARRARRCATSPSTPSSWARARTAASRTCARPPRCCAAGGRRRRADAGRARLGAGTARRPRRRASTRSSWPPAPSGAGRLLDVPGHEPRPAGSRASAAPPRPTATSRAARARAAAPTWSRRSVAAATAVIGRLASPADLRHHRRLTEPKESLHGQVPRPHRARRCRCDAATSTPTRSSPPSTSSGSPAHGYDDGLFAAWRKDPDFVLNRPEYRAPRSSSPAPSSARAPPASTRCGRCRTTGSESCSPRGSPTSSAATRGKAGLLTAVVDQDVIEQLWSVVESEPATAVTVDLQSRRVTAGADRRRSSRWTTTPAGGCWRASTTSGSRCSTPIRSLNSKPADRVSCRRRLPDLDLGPGDEAAADRPRGRGSACDTSGFHGQVLVWRPWWV